jgi:hypothetical protein
MFCCGGLVNPTKANRQGNVQIFEESCENKGFSDKEFVLTERAD